MEKNQNREFKSLKVEVPSFLHRALECQSTLLDVSLKEFVTDILLQYFYSNEVELENLVRVFKIAFPKKKGNS